MTDHILRSNQLNSEFQEYVDSPVQVIFTLEKSIKPPVTRSTNTQVETTDFLSGKLYSIRTSSLDFLEGFCLVKALTTKDNSLIGIVMEKCPEQLDESKLYYRQTKTTDQFEETSIISLLVSSCDVNVDTFSVNKLEIEEILSHTNVDYV